MVPATINAHLEIVCLLKNIYYNLENSQVATNAEPRMSRAQRNRFT